MGHNQLFSSTNQNLDELLMMYIYLNIDYTWGISNIYNKRKNLTFRQCMCIWTHPRAVGTMTVTGGDFANF